MSRFTYFPLYKYYYKFFGLAISLIALLLVLTINESYELLFYFGLLLIVFSKEKLENEKILNTRNTVVKASFGFYISLMISLNIVEFFTTNFIFNPSQFIYIGLPLIFYLVVFYLSLIFNVRLDSSIELKENILHNKNIYIVLFSVIVVLSSLYFVLKII